MIILGIWNYVLVFLVGVGKVGSSSIIIGFWGVYVGVGIWNASTMCSSSTVSGEVSACTGCRRGGSCLVYRISVCLVYISYKDRNIMSLLLFLWVDVRPLKRFGHPQK